MFVVVAVVVAAAAVVVVVVVVLQSPDSASDQVLGVQVAGRNGMSTVCLFVVVFFKFIAVS